MFAFRVTDLWMSAVCLCFYSKDESMTKLSSQLMKEQPSKDQIYSAGWMSCLRFQPVNGAVHLIIYGAVVY
jgi:hypothetical protein